MSITTKIRSLLLVSWKDVSKLSSYSAVKGGVFYVGICGIASKSLSGLSVIQVSGQNVLIDLPFSWRVLFYGTLSYIAGYLLYLIFCPKFLKSHISFVDLKNSGYTGADLQDELKEIHCDGISIPKHNKDTIAEVLSRLGSGAKVSATTGNECSNLMYESIVNNDIDKSREAYNMICNSLDRKYSFAKKLAMFLYISSACAVAFVFLQNIKFVLSNSILG